MNLFLKLLIAFLALTGASTILVNYFDVQFSHDNFWDNHGVFFLIFISFFPRLTLLFSSVPFGGFFWWLGWIFAPRLLVAVLATLAYWNANPFLVVVSWLVCLSAESGEKVVISRNVSKRRKSFTGDAFEAEYREL
jgi:hypothetical protein